ncbi:hypothetical protein BGZ63DRAFT_419873 [Mariannaea sp. PMI_226]|nr:hypothetical protein BGZ63DRAFT_419873 [Mariannaea sp. PMI_226]
MQRSSPPGVTNVKTCDDSGKSFSSRALHWTLYPVTNLIHRLLFPGNAGYIDYERLGRGREDLPHQSYKIKTEIGTIVGLHEYRKENTRSNIVVVFAHGNTRPTRFMKDFISSLLECDIRMVIGRDFVGYDASSEVPCHNGALEIAAYTNDVAVLNKLSEKYPECEFILCGRSIGTFFWAGQLHHPKVIGAIGVVPFSGPESIIQHALGTRSPGFIRKGILILADGIGLAQLLAEATFPHGHFSPDLPEFTSKGFELGQINPGVRGKQVVLFPSIDDELVPQSSVRDLESKLEAAECKVQTCWTEGGHRALPCSIDLQAAVNLIQAARTVSVD